MAMTNAERQRRHYERRKQAQKLPGDAATDQVRRPFFQAYQDSGNAVNVDIALDTAGIEPPSFADDSDPKSATGEIESGFADRPEESPYASGGGSLARAEIMVGCLIEAAAELASIVNAYKQQEIGDRIAEIEAADLSDAKERKRALAEIVKLKKMQDQLSGQVRWTFSQWKVPG